MITPDYTLIGILKEKIIENCSNLKFSKDKLKKIDKILYNNNYDMNSKEFYYLKKLLSIENY